jgi:hypothetical protein
MARNIPLDVADLVGLEAIALLDGLFDPAAGRFRGAEGGRRQHGALRRLRPSGASAVVVRPRHFFTVFGFIPYRAQGTGCSLATLGTRLQDTASRGRCREESGSMMHHQNPGLHT